jgi:hypothetical protein
MEAIKGTEKKWFNKQKNTVNFVMIKAGSRIRNLSLDELKETVEIK